MAKILMRRIETWRVDTEQEADELIAESVEGDGEVSKKTIEHKYKKKAGEIIDENLKVTIQVDFAEQFD